MKIIRLALLIVNLVFSGLLILSLTAPYVSPNTFWPLAILGLAFVPLIVINVLFLLYWAFQLKLRALIPAAALFLSLSSLGKLVGTSTRDSATNSNSIRVISHNTRGLNDDKGKRIDPTEYISYLKAQDPDIICFQEYSDWYYGKKKLRSQKVRDELKMKFYGHGRLKDLYRSLVIVTALPVVKTQSKYFAPPGSNGIMYADLIIPGGDTVRIINFHLESIGLSGREALKLEDLDEVQDKAVVKSKNLIRRLKNAFDKRTEQVLLLREWIEKSPYPLIVSGDMNDTPLSFAYHQVDKNLTDAFMEKGSGLGTTYQGPWPSYRIDYVFASDNIAVHDYETLSGFHSDHKPLSVSLSIGQ